MTFKILEEYYAYLEGDSVLSYPVDIIDSLTKLFAELSTETAKENCRHEILFHRFPIYVNPAENSEQNNGLNFADLSAIKDTSGYIRARAEFVVNQKYKAKYNHLLWYVLRDRKCGQIAVQSYIDLLRQSINRELDSGECLAFFRHFQALVFTSIYIQYLVEDALNIFLDNISTTSLNGYTKILIIEFLIESGPRKDNNISAKLHSYCVKVVDENTYPDIEEKFISITIALCSKLKLPTQEYHEKMAVWNLNQLKPLKDSFIDEHYYRNAMLHYQKAGNNAKVEEVSTLLVKARRNFAFKKTEINVDHPIIETLYKSFYDYISKKIESHDDAAIYRLMINGPLFIPTGDQLKVRLGFSELENIMKIAEFDVNHNTFRSKNSNDRKPGGLSYYHLWVQNFTFGFLNMIFRDGISNGTITFESLISHFSEKSWYSRDFTYKSKDGETLGFDWIELLKPSLKLFFYQSRRDIVTKSYNAEDYILCCDSLSLKFEGLIREFSRIIEAQTVDASGSGTSERISVDSLIANDKFSSALRADDLAFLRYLFTDLGINVRNKIAHCFLPHRKYSAAYMWLMITALLRFGNYHPGKMKSQNNQSNQDTEEN